MALPLLDTGLTSNSTNAMFLLVTKINKNDVVAVIRSTIYLSHTENKI
jgi:hypothetical protein